MREIPKAYNPKAVEDKIYQKWEKSGFFNPDKLKVSSKADYFSIAMPPPNATGTLHTGHAVMLAYEDLMVRYARLLGKKTLWLPGTDHASIATQAKVEKILYEKEKKTRQDLGREKFLQRVYDYVEKSRETIRKQVRKMGSSCDWSRERYTLDEGLSQVVKQAFIKMYNEGLIYRGYRIVNWCPRCASTLSDDEVLHEETTAKFYTFKYAKDFPIAIATTRPETKLGDTAVAVNPNDKRYKKYIGKTFTADLGHGEQKIKIVAEDSVDPKFGTGALGVTPAHSLIDYEIAQKNLLPVLKVIGEDGRMTAEAGKAYEGLTVLAAREKFVKWLDKQGLLEKVEEIPQSLSICYRCETPVEPLPSLQWFVEVNKKITLPDNKYFQNKSIKEVALQVVKDREIKVIPQRFEKDYYHWLEDLRDWCISRQIWFGHQIPVWYKKPKQSIQIKLVRLADVQVETERQEVNYKDVLETPLSSKGKQQTQELAAILKMEKIDGLLVPTEKAGYETGEILSKILNLKIVKDQRLNGVDLGSETMLSEKDIKAAYGLDIKRIIDYHWNIPYKDGESFVDVIKRSREFLIDLVDKYDGLTLVVVTSGSSFAAFRYLIEGVWPTELIAFGARADLELKEVIMPRAEPPQGANWQQDPDTLDTWFSSGLWTFSTLIDKDYKKYKSWDAWVKGSQDLQYHPTTVMETGYDILFFWVARMIIQTTFLMGEIPFKNIYLHGLVRDEKGKKMSKSKGNVVDPLDLIDKFGTDALRLAMISGTAAGMDMRLYDEKVEGARNFVNKLWNISRYILSSVSEINLVKKEPEPKTLADQWIFARLEAIISEITQDLNDFNFSAAIDALRDFTWSDLADWYLEISKLQMANSKLQKNTEEILLYILERLLILWHPFIPFVTEEIWTNFGCKELLMVQKWPSFAEATEGKGLTVSEQKEKINKDILYPFWKFEEIVMTIRNLRADFKIEPAKKVDVSLISKELDKIKFNEQLDNIKFLARLNKLEVAKSKPANTVSHHLEGVGEICLHLEGLVDLAKEKSRLVNEVASVKKYASLLEQKLKNKEFAKKAPKEIVEKEEFKLKEQKEKLGKLEEQLKSLT